jgi:hypothetical protein
LDVLALQNLLAKGQTKGGDLYAKWRNQFMLDDSALDEK